MSSTYAAPEDGPYSMAKFSFSPLLHRTGWNSQTLAPGSPEHMTRGLWQIAKLLFHVYGDEAIQFVIHDQTQVTADGRMNKDSIKEFIKEHVTAQFNSDHWSLLGDDKFVAGSAAEEIAHTILEYLVEGIIPSAFYLFLAFFFSHLRHWFRSNYFFIRGPRVVNLTSYNHQRLQPINWVKEHISFLAYDPDVHDKQFSLIISKTGGGKTFVLIEYLKITAAKGFMDSDHPHSLSTLKSKKYIHVICAPYVPLTPDIHAKLTKADPAVNAKFNLPGIPNNLVASRKEWLHGKFDMARDQLGVSVFYVIICGASLPSLIKLCADNDVGIASISISEVPQVVANMTDDVRGYLKETFQGSIVAETADKEGQMCIGAFMDGMTDGFHTRVFQHVSRDKTGLEVVFWRHTSDALAWYFYYVYHYALPDHPTLIVLLDDKDVMVKIVEEVTKDIMGWKFAEGGDCWDQDANVVFVNARASPLARHSTSQMMCNMRKPGTKTANTTIICCTLQVQGIELEELVENNTMLVCLSKHGWVSHFTQCLARGRAKGGTRWGSEHKLQDPNAHVRGNINGGFIRKPSCVAACLDEKFWTADNEARHVLSPRNMLDGNGSRDCSLQDLTRVVYTASADIGDPDNIGCHDLPVSTHMGDGIDWFRDSTLFMQTCDNSYHRDRVVREVLDTISLWGIEWRKNDDGSIDFEELNESILDVDAQTILDKFRQALKMGYNDEKYWEYNKKIADAPPDNLPFRMLADRPSLWSMPFHPDHMTHQAVLQWDDWLHNVLGTAYSEHPDKSGIAVDLAKYFYAAGHTTRGETRQLSIMRNITATWLAWASDQSCRLAYDHNDPGHQGLHYIEMMKKKDKYIYIQIDFLREVEKVLAHVYNHFNILDWGKQADEWVCISLHAWCAIVDFQMPLPVRMDKLKTTELPNSFTYRDTPRILHGVGDIVTCRKRDGSGETEDVALMILLRRKIGNMFTRTVMSAIDKFGLAVGDDDKLLGHLRSMDPKKLTVSDLINIHKGLMWKLFGLKECLKLNSHGIAGLVENTLKHFQCPIEAHREVVNLRLQDVGAPSFYMTENAKATREKPTAKKTRDSIIMAAEVAIIEFLWYAMHHYKHHDYNDSDQADNVLTMWRTAYEMVAQLRRMDVPHFHLVKKVWGNLETGLVKLPGDFITDSRIRICKHFNFEDDIPLMHPDLTYCTITKVKQIPPEKGKSSIQLMTGRRPVGARSEWADQMYKIESQNGTYMGIAPLDLFHRDDIDAAK